jgi:hypothetical protein
LIINDGNRSTWATEINTIYMNPWENIKGKNITGYGCVECKVHRSGIFASDVSHGPHLVTVVGGAVTVLIIERIRVETLSYFVSTSVWVVVDMLTSGVHFS